MASRLQKCLLTSVNLNTSHFMYLNTFFWEGGGSILFARLSNGSMKNPLVSPETSCSEQCAMLCENRVRPVTNGCRVARQTLRASQPNTSLCKVLCSSVYTFSFHFNNTEIHMALTLPSNKCFELSFSCGRMLRIVLNIDSYGQVLKNVAVHIRAYWHLHCMGHNCHFTSQLCSTPN